MFVFVKSYYQISMVVDMTREFKGLSEKVYSACFMLFFHYTIRQEYSMVRCHLRRRLPQSGLIWSDDGNGASGRFIALISNLPGLPSDGDAFQLGSLKVGQRLFPPP